MTLSPEASDLIKLKIEELLRKRSGHQVACTLNARDCIQGYQSLLGLDWELSPFSKNIPLVIGNSTGISRDRKTLTNQSQISPTELSELFQSTSESAADLVRDVANQFPAMATPQNTMCAKDEDNFTSPAPCPGKAAYYDHLFAADTFETTIVQGYVDSQEFEEQYSQYDYKIDFGLSLWKFEQQILTLENDGFKVVSKSDLETVLQRPFYYRGSKKVARVRLVRCTVACETDPQISPYVTYRKKGDKPCDAQTKATLAAKQAFIKAQGKSQLVIYNGHSRLGKGPDFGPFDSELGKVSLNQGAFDKLAFANPESIIYLNSCESSSKHSVNPSA